VAIRRGKKHVGRFAFPACRCEGFIASGNQAGVFLKAGFSRRI
jgi:hypothetical protein